MFSTSILLLLIAPAVRSRIHSLPEDAHAFPKFAVAFLNDQPVLNRTAEQWLAHGLRGGELEFLDQPWKDDPSHAPQRRKEIGSGDTPADTQATDVGSRSFAAANYTLEQMKMGSKDSYICYIPKAPDAPSTRQEEAEAEADATPARSWSLLQPLSGTCIYHRQGWFTYSYCHNEQIRQFREQAQSVSRLPAGTYQPEEDPEWESYTTLGADLTVAERNAQAANLELARNAGSRYLVQRWGDGTTCDKTGKPREVEVQFHCSMVMTDHILFVKEAKTCSYVLVIHTPRLCGEPGFRSRRDSSENSVIRCREVVDALPAENVAMPKIISDQPFKFVRPKTVLPPPLPKEKQPSAESPSPSSGKALSKDDLVNQLLKNALESMLAGGSQGAEGDDDSTNSLKEAIEAGELPPQQQRILDALQAAGLEVRGGAAAGKKGDKESKTKGKGEEKEEPSGLQPKSKGRLQKILQEHLEL
ncbi:hypothetical protein FA13DRAFT_1754770 [Coprinellus micaceus]|uniref:Protein OS-9 homolog n=1 Tax=Coprinellus micaceus TaxID=71717 RepID=A0A4Y7TAQ7_COPMI|nr:hypothetical protein FA13DRAFT_1754770 [Coprinellus micaceus]